MPRRERIDRGQRAPRAPLRLHLALIKRIVHTARLGPNINRCQGCGIFRECNRAERRVEGGECAARRDAKLRRARQRQPQHRGRERRVHDRRAALYRDGGSGYGGVLLLELRTHALQLVGDEAVKQRSVTTSSAARCLGALERAERQCAALRR